MVAVGEMMTDLLIYIALIAILCVVLAAIWAGARVVERDMEDY